MMERVKLVLTPAEGAGPQRLSTGWSRQTYERQPDVGEFSGLMSLSISMMGLLCFLPIEEWKRRGNS